METKFLPLFGKCWTTKIFPKQKTAFQVKTRFTKVFEGDYTSCIKDHVAYIVNDKKQSQVFCGAYKVLYGLRHSVEAEIDMLIKSDILGFSYGYYK